MINNFQFTDLKELDLDKTNRGWLQYIQSKFQ